VNPSDAINGRSSMFGLNYLFYPWGFLVQILAIVHFFRRRPETYWLYIIFLGGFLAPVCTLSRKCCRHDAASRSSPWIRPKVPRSDTRNPDFG